MLITRSSMHSALERMVLPKRACRLTIWGDLVGGGATSTEKLPRAPTGLRPQATVPLVGLVGFGEARDGRGRIGKATEEPKSASWDQDSQSEFTHTARHRCSAPPLPKRKERGDFY